MPPSVPDEILRLRDAKGRVTRLAIVAAREKSKLEAARENRKLKRQQQLAFVALSQRQTGSFTLNQNNSNLKCLKLHVRFCT